MEHRVSESEKSAWQRSVEENCHFIGIIQYKNGTNVDDYE